MAGPIGSSPFEGGSGGAFLRVGLQCAKRVLQGRPCKGTTAASFSKLGLCMAPPLAFGPRLHAAMFQPQPPCIFIEYLILSSHFVLHALYCQNSPFPLRAHPQSEIFLLPLLS